MKRRKDFIDLVGKKFGRLTVIKRVENVNPSKFLCICECGNKKDISSSCLRKGFTRSCGCLNRELTISRNYRHGEGIDFQCTREYRAWLHLKGRCLQHNDKSFKRYGGRGIKVCDRWLESYSNFLKDMGRCPKGYSIERVNNNGDYSPDNCIWLPLSLQAKNTSKNIVLTAYGKTMILKDWAENLGVSYGAIKWHLNKGKAMHEVVDWFAYRHFLKIVAGNP